MEATQTALLRRGGTTDDRSVKSSAAAAASRVTDPHLKDVYNTWLRDLYDDNPANVVKALRREAGVCKRKKKQFAHLVQPTEASASKHVATARKDVQLPTLRPSASTNAAASIQETQLRRHQLLAAEANCSSYQYRAPYQPGLAFFRLLVYAALDTTGSTRLNDLHRNNHPASSSKYEVPSFPVRLPPTLIRQTSGETRFRLALVVTLESDTLSVAGESFVLHVQLYTTERHFREHHKALVRVLTNTDHDTKAVSKYADDTACKSNSVFLLKSADEVEIAVDKLWTGTREDAKQPEGDCAIQKYVPYKGASGSNASALGNRKAWIARPVYRKKDEASWIWILTDCLNSEVTDSPHDGCQIVKCSGLQSWSEPRLLASTVSQMVETLLQISFTELAMDLLQDNEGKWWLLQVEAFQIRRQRPSSAACASQKPSTQAFRVSSAPNRFEDPFSAPALAHRKWRCAGRYCISVVSDNNEQLRALSHPLLSEPSGRLTKKVLLSCEFYDMYTLQQDMSLASGFANFEVALASHLQHRISKRDRNQLYESQPLCTACIGKYHSLREKWTEMAAPEAYAPSKRVVRSTKARGSPAHPPRLLPSLQAASTAALPESATAPSTSTALKQSVSAPLLSSPEASLCIVEQVRTMESSHRDSTLSNQFDTERRRDECLLSYLNEMNRIEEMLAQREDKHVSTTQQDSHRDAPRQGALAECDDDASSKYFSSFMQLRNEANSVEQMWSNVSLKPLLMPSARDRPRPQYNSYSLQDELQQLDASNSSAEGDAVATISPLELPHALPEKHGDHARRAHHTIAIPNCHQVFYDEPYRESLANEARAHLVERHHSVQFAVTPPTTSHVRSDASAVAQQPQTDDGSNDDELADMVLRTLFLDLSLSIGSLLVPDRLKRMPPISRESGGCVSMVVPS